ncbi:MAG: hypothetical protein ACJ75J_11835 [Cytophagaceae bacterium]
MEFSRKKIFLIGGLCYLSLGILAAIFYKERTIMFDMSLHTFYILKTSDFAIQCQRFGAAVTQVFPLLASKMNLPLPQVLLLYSLAFVIWHFIVFMLCLFFCNSRPMAIVTTLFSVLITAKTFYWIQSELIQAICFLIFFFAYLLKKRELKNFSIPEIILTIGLLIIAIYFHPLIPMLFLFLALYFWLRKDHLISDQLLLSSVLLLGLILLVKNTAFKTPDYDALQYNLLDNFIKLFPDYFTIDVSRNFIEYCLSDYYFLPILLLVNSLVYFRQKKYLLLLFQVCSFLGMLFLVNITHYLWHPQFYMESLYLPLALAVIVPFVFDVLPLIQNKNITYGIIILILAIRIPHIALTHKLFTERIHWYRNLLSKVNDLPQKKLILPTLVEPLDTMLMNWGSSYELLILSSLENPDSAKCIIIEDNPERLRPELYRNKALFTPWEFTEFNYLPHHYFHPTDTSCYRILTLEEFKK